MSDEPDRDLLAAEYVLGALTPEQARALEALALHDTDVADSIAAWQERLAPLAELVPPQIPPPLLWRRLVLATGLEEPPAAAPGRLPLRSSLGFWRGATAAALALAACLGFLLIRPGPEPPPLLAVLSQPGAPAPGFLVRVDADGRATVLASGNRAPPPGRSYELWALRERANAPVSLGVLPAAGRVRLPLAEPAGTKLLVSEEPQGGSPTGSPTGPVVFSGTLTRA